MCLHVFIFDYYTVCWIHKERSFDIRLWIGENEVNLASILTKSERAQEKDTTCEPGNER